MENKLLRSYFNQEVRIYNLFGFLVKYESSYFLWEAHGDDAERALLSAAPIITMYNLAKLQH